MVYGLPTDGEPNWGAKVNASIEAVKTTADAALPAAQTGAASGVAPLDADQKLPEANVPERLSEANLAASYGAGVRGVAGRKYAVVAGALRNPGGPDYWQTIEDADHRSTNIDSVTTSTSTITINHAAIGASRVVAFNITPDEALMKAGYTVGASAGLASTTLTLGRTYPEVADYVYYDGSAWVSNLGVFTPSFSEGTLTLTHASIDSTAAAWNASVTPRDGTYLVSAGSLGLESMTVQFRDYAGTLITTPDTNMKCYVTHGGGRAAAINPQAIDTTTYPFSNFWFEAVFEV